MRLSNSSMETPCLRHLSRFPLSQSCDLADCGAGFDVFTEDPAKQNVLFGATNLVSTPHLESVVQAKLLSF